MRVIRFTLADRRTILLNPTDPFFTIIDRVLKSVDRQYRDTYGWSIDVTELHTKRSSIELRVKWLKTVYLFILHLNLRRKRDYFDTLKTWNRSARYTNKAVILNCLQLSASDTQFAWLSNITYFFIWGRFIFHYYEQALLCLFSDININITIVDIYLKMTLCTRNLFDNQKSFFVEYKINEKSPLINSSPWLLIGDSLNGRLTIQANAPEYVCLYNGGIPRLFAVPILLPSRPNVLQFRRLEIRGMTFPNYIEFEDRRILTHIKLEMITFKRRDGPEGLL